MSKIIYINGNYLFSYKAKLSVNDRSFLFSDAVYEVVAVFGKKLVFWREHIDRLKKSVNSININYIVNSATLKVKAKEIIEKNSIDNGLIYIHISRGQGLRNHNWENNIKPSLVISGLHKKISLHQKAINLISSRDIRWKRCDIKSVSLLPNVILKQEAKIKGAFECVMIDDKGFVTEATTSNLWIIKDDILITRPLGTDILSGVTRKKIIEIAKSQNIKIKFKKFQEKDIYLADGVFISNSSSFVLEAKKMNNIKLKYGKNSIIKKIKGELFNLI